MLKAIVLLSAFWCSECKLNTVPLNDIIDADMEFYRHNIGDEEEHTMLIKLDGEGLHLENVTVKPYNNWKRESGDAILSLDTELKKYSFEYRLSLNDFEAVFGSLKLPSWPDVRYDVRAKFDKVIFRFGPMSRVFLPGSQCNSSLSVSLEDASVKISDGGEDVSEVFRSEVARAFDRKSRALCNIVNPHPCSKIFTPLMYGHF